MDDVTRENLMSRIILVGTAEREYILKLHGDGDYYIDGEFGGCKELGIDLPNFLKKLESDRVENSKEALIERPILWLTEFVEVATTYRGQAVDVDLDLP
jgi:hypothetical protein